MESRRLRFLTILKRERNFPFICLGLLILFLIIAFSFPPKQEQELVFFPNLVRSFKSESNEKLFLAPIVSQREYPDLGLIQNNSLVGFSSPLLIESQILAMMTQAELDTSGEIIEYVIKEGDSLWSIAEKFGIYIDTIVWANNIKSALIKPGQKLLILPVDGVMHLVEEGDTISKLAERYKTEPKRIIDFNGLKGEKDIFAGEILIIPDGVMPYEAKVESAALVGLSTNDFYGQSHHFPYGQCTWWVAQKRAIPNWGNAGDWFFRAKTAGYETCPGRYCIPRTDAIICLKGHRLGHVGYVGEAWGDKVKFSEMNYLGWGRMNYRTLTITDPSIIGYIY